MSEERRRRWRTAWDRQAPGYDRQMARMDRFLFKDTRAWVCRRATGDVLEVAIGTGLNLPLYPAGVRLTGVELSPAMLERARHRAGVLGLDADLRVGDAEALDLPDGSFDTVVCTFSLCAIPDHERALAQMHRVLRPDGRLLLADHVAGAAAPIRAVQRLTEAITVPMAGEHFRRRPHDLLGPLGLVVEERERFGLGLVERLSARKGAPRPHIHPAGA